MSIEDHIKLATSEIAKASDLMRQEINQLRDQDVKLSDLNKKQLAQVTAELTLREKEAQSATDDNIRSQAQIAIDKLRRELSEKNKQLTADKQRIIDSIKQKENAIAQLDQQLRNLK